MLMKANITLGIVVLLLVLPLAAVLAAPGGNGNQQGWVLSPIENYQGDPQNSVAGPQDDGGITTQATLINTDPEVWVSDAPSSSRVEVSAVRLTATAMEIDLRADQRASWPSSCVVIDTTARCSIAYENINGAPRALVGNSVDALADALGRYVGLVRFGDDNYALRTSKNPITDRDWWID